MTQLIVIYVRKPRHLDGKESRPEGRTLSFKTPENLNVQSILEAGFYFDGNSTVCEFIPDASSKPFPVQLLEKEREIVEILTSDGYDVEFS